MDTDRLRAYRRHITDTYDARSGKHDNSDWHRSTALKLVEELPPRTGDAVLDIGTGTGTIAFHAAARVGRTGTVVGIDLSQGMLAEAARKRAAAGPAHLDFVLADAEHPGFAANAFDRIYCASAFFCMLDPPGTLREWHRLLKPGGGLAFHALPETSYFWVAVARDVLAEHGFPYRLNTPTGTPGKTRRLLEQAGFDRIDIRVDEQGYYLPLARARESWITVDDFAPGQYPHPVRDIPPETLARCKREYLARIEALGTDQGVWNDVTMYYVRARKPHPGSGET